MVVCMHRFLVEGIVITVCFHYSRVASEGKPRSGYPGSNNGDATGGGLLRQGIIFGSSYWMVELGGEVVCFYHVQVGESR
jgi:hypothetical protein